MVRLGDEQDVADSILAGASGYLLKDASRSHILEVIRKVLNGESAIDPGLTMRVLQSILSPQSPPQERPIETLTHRETEVLRLVAKGLSYKQIAERLVLSHRTVQNHVQNTLRKLQMHNRVQLVRYAIEQGLDGE